MKNKSKILLVDDERVAMSYYVRYLDARGFEVEQQTNIRDALRFIEGSLNEMRAVVLDLVLPPDRWEPPSPEGGLEVLAVLRRRFPEKPVVVLTNTDDPSVIAAIERMRPTKVLHKYNCPPNLLGEILEGLIQGASQDTGAGTAEPPTEQISNADGDSRLPTATELEAISVGSEGASRYHDWILGALQCVFDNQFGRATKEQRIESGQKRIDIVFQNTATRGFFFDLLTRYHVRCPWIIAECKNYVADPGNPEVDQLVGRFSRNRGEFGLLLCRRISDPQLILSRCLNVVNKDRGFVLALDDTGVCKLLQARTAGDYKAIDAFMHEEFAKLVL